jgi:predicted ATP-dependent endonuclease of OLD family
MDLIKVHVTNFRSVEDSGEFDGDKVLCLVGKNEAGKTAVLQALSGLNPHPMTPISYNLERDYPRRWLNEYAERHKKEQARVILTKWKLTDAEKKTIRAEIGDALLDTPVTVYRRYGDAEPQWEDLPINFKKAVANLIASEKLDDEESKSIASCETSDKLREGLEAVKEPTARQKRLLDRLTAYPNKNVTGWATSILKPGLPHFMYSSHYDRMVGEIRLDTYAAREKAQPPQVVVGERIFIDFLEYAGTSLSEIQSAVTYETLNARCESASSKITEQLLEYWTQNPTLEIEVRVTKAEPKDLAPFNEGIVARARVKNNVHKLTLPFSERSAGFVWFFSFLVKFAQVRKTGGKLILLLDEPGLTLHGKAQADLLRYFNDKLAPHHQVIFSTHSPFMVPADNLPSVRVVEDKLIQSRPGRWIAEGTKVRDDSMTTDRDTLFPLQGALGYEITQSLFVGKNTMLVEGPGDILYLESLSSELIQRGKRGLDRRWTLCPAGGIDKIQPFVGLFAAQKLNMATISDYSKADAKKIENLRRTKILESDRILTFATLLGVDEADIEDIFAPALFATIINSAFNLPSDQQADAQKLAVANPNTTRLVKKAEAFFAVLPPDAPEFDHFTPAEWLFRNAQALSGDSVEVTETLKRAEAVIAAINKILAPLAKDATA